MQTAGVVLIAMLLIVGAVPGQQQPRPLDLSEAEVVATHETFGGQYPPARIMDGDEATFWAGDGHDLTVLPTSILLTLPEPAAVGRLEVLTQTFKNRLRLTDLEVYARAGEGWALLGAARANEQERFAIDLRPAQVKQLRLRVLNTARPDHA